MDANVYVAYFLGEENEELVERLFRRSLDCRFSLTASTHLYREVQHVCQDKAAVLIRQHLDSFTSARKLDVIHATASEVDWAAFQNLKTHGLLGLNDWIHIRLSSIHSDVLVSNDRMLRLHALPWVRCLSLEEFLDSL